MRSREYELRLVRWHLTRTVAFTGSAHRQTAGASTGVVQAHRYT